MKLEFYNCPKPGNIKNAKLPEEPEFLAYRPDFELMGQMKEKYGRYKNILILAHGGSTTTFFGIYYSLKNLTKKKAYFLNTVDPDYIYDLKKKLNREQTLVIPISKSGETVTLMEMLMQFADYPLLFITGRQSPLKAVADKLKAEVVAHPPIGGRYTGMTE